MQNSSTAHAQPTWEGFRRRNRTPGRQQQAGSGNRLPVRLDRPSAGLDFRGVEHARHGYRVLTANKEFEVQAAPYDRWWVTPPHDRSPTALLGSSGLIIEGDAAELLWVVLGIVSLAMVAAAVALAWRRSDWSWLLVSVALAPLGSEAYRVKLFLERDRADRRRPA